MRVKRGTTTRKKHKKIFKATKGMSHARTSSIKKAKEALLKSLSYQYRDRRNRKRDFRSLWITRISAACRENGLKYSEFIKNLKNSKIEIDRKILADIAVNEPNIFKKITEEK
jgi:large subunit ribosomal protein L20